MQHVLTIGFLDQDAANKGLLKVLKPLEPDAVRECLKDMPWIGWEGDLLALPGVAESVSIKPVVKVLYLDYRGKLHRPAIEVAAMLQKKLGCVVTDYNHGMVYTAAGLDLLTQKA